MAKKRWIISAPDEPNPLGGKGNSAHIHSKAELDKRVKAAKAAGVHVNVREIND